MWIFASKGFVSVVRHREKPGILLVRARKMDDLKEFVGAKHHDKCFSIQHGDYAHRAELSEEEFVERMTQQIREIRYPNFKNSISSASYHRACSSVWKTMFDYGRGTQERDDAFDEDDIDDFIFD